MGIDEKYIINVLSSEINDDVSFVKLNDNLLVLKCDMLVRRTDAPSNMRLWQIARKSIVSSMSDMICKGVTPLATLISLAVPKTFTKKDIKELAKGFKIAEEEFGIKIIGGDTNESDDLIIDCIMAGIANKIVKRGDAKEGDLIISTGLFGYTSAGLKILLDNAVANARFRRIAVNSVLMPKPRIEFINVAKYANSSMDSSDGLAATLNELSLASNTCFVIDNIPSVNDVYQFAKNNNYDAEQLIFDGGEEYEIIATIPKEHLENVRKIMNVYVIGSVRKGKGVYIKYGNKLKRLRRKGFIHLANK